MTSESLPNGWEAVRQRVDQLIGTEYGVFVDAGGDNYRYFAGPIAEVKFENGVAEFRLEWYASSYTCIEWTLENGNGAVFRHNMNETSVDEDFTLSRPGPYRRVHTFDSEPIMFKMPKAAA